MQITTDEIRNAAIKCFLAIEKNYKGHLTKKGTANKTPFEFTYYTSKAGRQIVEISLVIPRDSQESTVFNTQQIDGNWLLITYRPGQWVDKLQALLKELETENFSEIDDSKFFA